MKDINNYFSYIDNFAKYKDVKSVLLFGKQLKSPKITIAIPTYNRVLLLKNALKSAINQTDFNDYEIIVIDNNDDFEDLECLNLIKELNCEKISYYKNKKNIGMFGNWNRCIELANGEFITILNDDDWLEKNYLFEITKYIKNKRAIFVRTNVIDLRKHNKNLKVEYKKILKNIFFTISKIKKLRKYTISDFLYGNPTTACLGILFHKESLKSLGGYNSNFFPSSDYFCHAYYVYQFGGIQLKKALANYQIFENESLKIESAKGWVREDSKFRKYLAENILKIDNLEMLDHMTNKQISNINEAYNHHQKFNTTKIKTKFTIKILIRKIILELFG